MGVDTSKEKLDGFGIKASMTPAFEVCMLAQAICVFGTFFMATRSQTISVVLSAIACALAVPSMGIILLSLLDRGDQTERIGLRESVVESAIAVVISLSCLLMFFPRFGRFAETNPYSNEERLQCIVEFVVGKQFVVPGSIQSDGLIMKVPEGEEVTPPTVLPKPGLTFVGWRYSGTGDPDIAVGTPIYLDANGTQNNSVILYAEYVDAQGNAYCACGATGDREFDGASWQNMNTRNFLVAFVPLAAASVVGIVVLMGKGRNRKGDATRATDMGGKATPKAAGHRDGHQDGNASDDGFDSEEPVVSSPDAGTDAKGDDDAEDADEPADEDAEEQDDTGITVDAGKPEDAE